MQRWELGLLERVATEAPVEVIAPFRAIPGQLGLLSGFDYAIPVDDVDGSIDDAIARLRTLYRRRHAPLRIEYNESAWPQLGSALSRAGLELASRNPLMVSEAKAFRPVRIADVRVRFDATDRRHPLRMRAVAEIAEVIAGHGSIAGAEGVAELYGVITEERFRRRGVAATLCSALMAWHYDHGGSLVFLEADRDEAVALYRTLGFDQVDWRYCYIEP